MVSRKLLAVILAGAMAASPTFAASNNVEKDNPPQANMMPLSNQGPLPPGKAATVKEAQGIGRPLLWWGLGGAAIIAGVVFLSQSGNKSTTTSTTTTTTSTTTTSQ